MISCFGHVWLLCDPMDCSPQDSSVHGILQARIKEWVVMPSSRGASQPRDQTHISYRQVFFFFFFTTSTTWALAPPLRMLKSQVGYLHPAPKVFLGFSMSDSNLWPITDTLWTVWILWMCLYFDQVVGVKNRKLRIPPLYLWFLVFFSILSKKSAEIWTLAFQLYFTHI